MGYTGGTQPGPSYRQIGDHSEALEIQFDPEALPYSALVDMFWTSHNPMSQNWSRQYQAILFTHNREQARIADQTRAQLAENFDRPIQTAIQPAGIFYQAEGYHQKYRLRATKAICQEFTRIYPEEADFIRSTAAARVNGYLAGYGTLENLQRDLPGLGLSPEGNQYLLSRFEK